ncbi:hypothetical protein [Sansalvadorimonas verongulae]|uniref:hypothetical protein n=1 Tax=Sansalvadorimonas verongulae TaxID=2172824 RepID=UPI0012BBB136|nr:hypothetical protein [Sansalvadorimonas verongulae]MTI12374.1 hypothetical protein [Sansalvadorimonas verongulae]
MSEPWHIDKKISITHVISTMMIVASLFVWGGGIERRIDRNAQDIEQVREIQKRNWDANREQWRDTKDSMNKMNSKLDRLIERQ